MPIKIIRGNGLASHDMMRYIYEAWKNLEGQNLVRYLRASALGHKNTRVNQDLLFLADLVKVRDLS